MSEASEANRYWQIVQACLVEIYGMEPQRASSEVDRLWSPNSKRASLGRARDMTYHAQPLHVAGNIAKQDSPMTAVTWKRYEEILQRLEDVPQRKDPVSALSSHDAKAFSAR